MRAMVPVCESAVPPPRTPQVAASPGCAAQLGCNLKTHSARVILGPRFFLFHSDSASHWAIRSDASYLVHTVLASGRCIIIELRCSSNSAH